MSDTEFVYTTYIRTTPEKLWQALTDPAFTRRYWGTEFDSDWEKGSPVVWFQNGLRIEHPDQLVLESQPYRRLAYTWHTFPPEFARTVGIDPEEVEAMAAEPRSRVSFDLDLLGDVVKLTVVHQGFEPGSTVLAGISSGWPPILSNLKTLLETGETLPV
jgi:uncharacterized protein YndB with AHSA1/START domain